MVGGDVQRIDALDLHVADEIGEVAAVGLDRVIRQEHVADPRHQRPGGGRSVAARGGQGLGQEGLDLGRGGRRRLQGSRSVRGRSGEFSAS